MSNKMRAIAFGGILSATFSGSVLAADVTEPLADDSGWSFTAAAYLFASGLEGDSGVFGFQPQEIDLSFSDVLANLDIGFMGLGEARNGRFSIGMDIAYAKLGTEVNTPLGIAATSIDVTAETFMGTAIAGYSLIHTDTAHLDAIAGARLWSVNTEFDFKGGGLNGQSASDGATWVDPLVGAKFNAGLGSDFYISGWGMVGGFGVSSDLMWDVMGGLGYNVNDSFSVFGGYRAVSVDYSNDGFVYDIVQQGPMFAGVFRF